MSENQGEETLFNKYSNLMNRKIKGVEIGCYSIALLSLTYALRRVRPFSRFKKPNDIPKRFIKERRELTGIVERIEPNGALLMINHQPLIPLLGSKTTELPSKIAGVELSGHAISWLQTLVAGNRVTFVPVKKENQFVECQVKLEQISPKNEVKMLDLGSSLVQIGFAKVVEKPLSKKDPDYGYYMKLKNAEEIALKKQMGMKYYIKPTKLILLTIWTQLEKIIRKMLQSSSRNQKALSNKKVPKTMTA
ncbi:protein C3orf33 homolog [Onthophagus taurus]|uniref:protein C3orf33 homolog n=1 Tax=Onthophagus taurus TaxID=166361 RepID=UPI000C202806|nr:uncharacterized protein LOC111422884 [Onthophagus taurus]XP_022911913.1 uncharacterized protein LOC111422884 [Onthophagus taurus]